MNYYIQGSPERAAEIKAAFEKLGYKTRKFDFRVGVFYTYGKELHYAISDEIASIIKTHPDYKELELPVKPNFKAGDWLVYKNGNCFAGGLTETQVVKVKDGVYFFASGTTGSFKFIDETCRLRKIKPHYDIKNFKPFDKVLVRDSNNVKWRCAWFSHYNKMLPYPFITTGADHHQCIPFNEDTKHLLGTTDMCDEQYINW